MNNLNKLIKVVISKEDIREVDLKNVNLEKLKDISVTELNKLIIGYGEKKMSCTDADRERIKDILDNTAFDKKKKIMEIRKVLNKI